VIEKMDLRNVEEVLGLVEIAFMLGNHKCKWNQSALSCDFFQWSTVIFVLNVIDGE
jgi:hypothetical protein